MRPIETKVTIIGGGSRYWARDLISELAQTPTLTGVIELYDIDHAAAERNVAVAAAMFARPEARTRFTVRAVRRLAQALPGSDFVVLSIEPGPTEARYADLVIPARYGVLQPVGDTTGPGGLARAMRAVPLYVNFARAIAEHCPRAWVINYTNPMTLCVAALLATVPETRAFGCCHEVFNTQRRFAQLASRHLDVPTPPREEIAIELSGINHFTWVSEATWRGQTLMPLLRAEIARAGSFRSHAAQARAAARSENWFRSTGLVASDLFRRFGALGAAGDRHLVEFVSWYATSEADLHRWGVVLTPFKWRIRRSRENDIPVSMYKTRPLTRSKEEGVKLIEALLGVAPLDTNVNLPNRGQAPDLPSGHVVETNARFRSGRVAPAKARPLPPAVRALVRRAADTQALALQATLARDVDGAFQAMLCDPLVTIPVDRAWMMFREMLDVLRPHLPGWRLPGRPSVPRKSRRSPAPGSSN